MSLATSSPLDKTLESFAAGKTASGQTYGEYLFSWMANMHDHLSRTPGVQVTRATITLGAGEHSLGFAWDFGASGKPIQTTMTGPSTKLGKASNTTMDSRKVKAAPSTTTSTAPARSKSTSTKASSQSKSGYTSAPSDSGKSTKTSTSTRATETPEQRAKRKSREASTTPSVSPSGISELPASTVASTKTEARKENLPSTPAVTTTTSTKSTKPAKLELSTATDAGLHELAATPASSTAPTATTTATTSKPTKGKKKVGFTDSGFDDRKEATSVLDIPTNREYKEYNLWRYRDDLTDVDDKTRSRLSRYAKSKRLKSYQDLAQKTGIPVESASEFYTLASKPETDDSKLQKYGLKHWNRPAGTTEVPYAYSTYSSAFPQAGTADATTDKSTRTTRRTYKTEDGTEMQAKKGPPKGADYEKFLQDFVKVANEHKVSRDEFLTYDSAASIAGADTAALEALAKELGHSKNDFDSTRSAIISGAPDTLWTEGEYSKVINALPKKASAK